ncbi:MAG: enoyl-CoA hydratase/isomerase family protein [Comamonadaceae bacterium]|jgi:enoyl-CoA hydratase/carnithine racemase|uniref:enoyl-CoA hydratase/isomerase family protein n=1 Tax=Candidatus Skiveiella danica TaxID=3386177 RepID=UPI001B751984|nr:enoyl-CoA hydratase/isomerase family protein [Comamonadaceae bacterium]MBK6558625.1 enoyl-CoA hydratase/isomerase family protein [Comamonadaceae bacterium]MBP8102343.1 enoyl-CoA hydratase/isomerase family protein [Burkholderiaceae bacterium]
MAGQVRIAADGGISRVTLSHAGKLNAMSRAMWRELRSVFEGIQQDASIRCVIVEGEGGHFCAGGDIAEYPAFRFSEQGLRDFHEDDVWGGLDAMLCCDVPLVAQIEGNCMGAGVEIASCCDIRVAGASAKFGAPIACLGFPMAPREAKLVSEALGGLTAREMLLEAAVLDAPTLLLRGFLNGVLTDADVAGEALARARRIAALAPQAARLNKQTFRTLNQLNPSVSGSSDAMEFVANSAYAYADSAEHREGIAAFLGKRKPVF